MNTIQARMGDASNAARAIIISPQSAFTSRHVTESVTTICLSKDGQEYRPNNLGWVAWKDRDGVTREDAEPNYSILLRSELGLDISQLSPSRQFPLEAVEPLATVKAGDTVEIESRALGRNVTAKVIRGTPDEQWTVELDYVPSSGDSCSLVTLNGVFVGLVSAASPGGCLVSVPPIEPLAPGAVRHEGQDDPVPEPIAVPTNPTSPYTPPAGSTPEFKAGVLWGLRKVSAELQAALAAV